MGAVNLSLLRDARWFGRERAVGYAATIMIAYLPGLAWCYVTAIGPLGSDYLAYWSAAHFVLSGHPADAYRAASQNAFQASLGRPYFFPFLYPPPFLAMVAPFGLLPYAVSLPAWVVSTFSVYLAVARRLMPGALWPAAAFSAAYLNAVYGQNGFVTAALFIAGILNLERRPLVAGLLLGGLVVKPQLALLLPVALVAGGQWRALLGAAVSSVGLLAAAALVFGPDTTLAFLHSAHTSSGLLSDANASVKTIVSLFPKMPTAFALVRVLGGGYLLALAVQGALTAVLAAVVWRTWSGPGDMLAKGAVLAIAAVLATPYLFDYDMVLLILPICWLAREGMRHGFWPWEKAMLAVVYWMPFIGQATTAVFGANLAILSSLMLLWMVLRRWRRPSPQPDRSAAALAAAAPISG